MILEGKLGDRISCTTRSETSSGVAAPGYPASIRYDRNVQLQINEELPDPPHRRMIEHRLHGGA